MPQIGDTARAKEIGKAGRGIYIWAACPDCNTGRWKRGREVGLRCRSCAASRARIVLQLPGSQRKKASELGYKGRAYFYAEPCPDCGEEQWRTKHRLGLGIRCGKCNCEYHSRRLAGLRGENSPCWTGGKYISKRTGYVMVRLQPDDPFFCMADKRNRRVHEHRLVYARHTGRMLLSTDIIHHKNGIRSDNRFENLEKLPRQVDHMSSIAEAREINKLKKRVAELEQRTIILEGELVRREAMMASTVKEDRYA